MNKERDKSKYSQVKFNFLNILECSRAYRISEFKQNKYRISKFLIQYLSILTKSSQLKRDFISLK